MRETVLFDEAWLFHQGDIFREEPKMKGPIYSSAKAESMKWGPACRFYQDSPDNYTRNVEYNADKWVYVDLPHDYVVAGEMYENKNPALGFFRYDNAWYRKHFEIPKEDEGKRITLLFEGVATRCTVFLNGCELKHNHCGYTSFEVDLTDYLFCGEENILAVYVTYHQHEGWWYQGGGIYRHVWLKKTEPVACEQWGVFLHAEKQENSWCLTAETEVRNDTFASVSAVVTHHVLDQEGHEVASLHSSVGIPPRSKQITAAQAQVNAPHVWDIEDPYQYEVITEISVNNEICDTEKNRFGFREYAFTKDGFFLNGRKVFINGVCGHGDFGLTGKAVPDNIFRHKVRMMKEMGANGYRCSHYPQAAAMMDALDENGFIVMAEARWFHSTDEGLEQLRMLVRRDRNRPSVFMWSMGNEEPHHLTEVGRRINRAMIAETKKLDPTRPTTSAVSDKPDRATVYDDMELVGINYNHYLYDLVRQKYPDKPIYASECCATSTTRGWYEDDDPQHGYINAYDHDTTSWFIGRETFMQVVKEHPWLCGMFQWIAFEHRGEAVWPRICSQAGAIDLFLQRKDAFYQNQSIFLQTPMLHLMPHWNWPHRVGENIPVWAYTTCEECELFLNGKSLGKQKCERFRHVEWSVTYEPGILEAIGYVGGKAVVSDRHETTGKPVRLALKLENGNDLHANKEDIALFTCTCLDGQGREVPDAKPYVSFYCNGLGRIVGTGSDVSDHTSVACPNRKMRAGKISIAVRMGDKPGLLKVWAESENLDTAVCTQLVEKEC